LPNPTEPVGQAVGNLLPEVAFSLFQTGSDVGCGRRELVGQGLL
jgi:hypothetical protein